MRTIWGRCLQLLNDLHSRQQIILGLLSSLISFQLFL
jgi:hypothetical protein